MLMYSRAQRRESNAATRMMLSMRKQGMTDTRIARLYPVSKTAVTLRLLRFPR